MMNIKNLCKLIGALLVMAGTVGVGMCYVKERREGLFYARKAVQMLKAIQHLVAYEKRTFAEACEFLSREEDSPYMHCFGRIVNRVHNREGEDFRSIWESEFREEVGHMHFTAEEIDRLVKVPSCMAATEPGRSSQMIEDVVQFFEERVEKRKEQTEEREKVILSVCMMAGVLIVILFW